MLENNQQSQQELSQNINSESVENPIPPQYQGMPSEIVEEMWQNPIYIDEEKNQFEIQRRNTAIEAIKQAEFDREAQKQQFINERYASLSDSQKLEFPNYQKEASDLLSKHIRGEEDLENLSGEEAFVLQKLKDSYENFKKDHPNESFNFQLEKDIDKSVYNNLVQKLSFKVLENKQILNDQQKANDIREKLGIPGQEIKVTDIEVKRENESSTSEQIEDKDYQEFRVKNGETDVGAFWYEYRNSAAKKLEKIGKFKWGEERIYFDIPTDDMERLRDLVFSVANEEKIPIAFKHLDMKKTTPVHLKEGADTTRFVTNFSSIEDAKRFYEALKRKDEYGKMKSDRNLDYQGLQLDNVAHYGSGYREHREALRRIVETARKNKDNSYTYNNVDGSKEITITEEQYNDFTNKFKLMPNLQDLWDNTGIQKKEN